MKKTLAIVMALIMVLACTNGLASSYIQPTPWVDPSAAAFVQNTAASDLEYDQNTDGWLQVVAGDTKLDVTVPLVIIFQTSVAGGNANTAKNYGIYNNSVLDICVQEIKIDGGKATSMDMKGYNSVSNALTSGKGEFGLKLTCGKINEEDPLTSSTWASGKTWANSGSVYTRLLGNGSGVTEFAIGQKTVSGPTFAPIKVDMNTSPIGFMTQTGDGTNECGLKIFNISYKVKLDNDKLIGNKVQEPNATGGYKYNITDGKI